LLGRRVLVTGAGGGVAYLSYAHPEPPAPDLAILARLVATGQVDPVIGLTTNWAGLPDATTALAQRRLTGKAVLTID
jgi:NADPH:quinone reductase